MIGFFFAYTFELLTVYLRVMSNSQPIGIFDSGIGGLTVASAIRSALPHESIVYFGDTAHMPYGEKTQTEIQKYALRITEFLLNTMQCKAVVIACNTASAAAYEVIRDKYKGSVPIISVIDPMIEEVIADDKIKKIGIIATRTTIKSQVYQQKFSRRKPQLHYSALATPLLATMIEEGYYDNSVSSAVLENYLSNPALKDIDGLVLGCTHYPLIKQEIDAFYQGKIRIFDSAQVVAAKLAQILKKESLLSEEHQPESRFFASENSDAFIETTRIFFPEKIEFKKVDLWTSENTI